MAKQSEELAELLSATRSERAILRRRAVREMCPCKVKHDIDAVWTRLLEMVHDPDEDVRYAVMHTLCDGSPKAREADVVAALESLYNDPSEKLRRKVRHAVTSYRRGGSWNIL